ncbi:MAG TPA: hypothetical protein VNQ76_01135 [Planctomicrobium sp.]|nr:hypothetical protein [Planctomicrobium sp.]
MIELGLLCPQAGFGSEAVTNGQLREGQTEKQVATGEASQP